MSNKLKIGDIFERKNSSRNYCVRGFTLRGDVIATFPHEPRTFYPILIPPDEVTAITGNIYRDGEAQHES
jgi:hypothetical protein